MMSLWKMCFFLDLNATIFFFFWVAEKEKRRKIVQYFKFKKTLKDLKFKMYLSQKEKIISFWLVHKEYISVLKYNFPI